jgi:hypothetical protein
MKIEDLVMRLQNEVLSDKRRLVDGHFMKILLIENGFMDTRTLKYAYRKFYEMGLIPYIRSNFPSEVVNAGKGFLGTKSQLFHISTIEKAIEKFCQEME